MSLALALWSAIAGTQAMMAARTSLMKSPSAGASSDTIWMPSLHDHWHSWGCGHASRDPLRSILFALTGYSDAFELVVGVARWPFLGLFVLSILALLYRYGACRRTAKWHWVSVGSLFAMVVWLIASAGFSLYVSNFANYIGFTDRLAPSSSCCSGSTSLLHRSDRRRD